MNHCTLFKWSVSCDSNNLLKFAVGQNAGYYVWINEYNLVFETP